MMAHRFAIVAFCAFLAGCASIDLVEPGAPVTVGESITVEPQAQWASFVRPGMTGTVWTIDGLGLQELRFYIGTEAGDPFVTIQGVPRDELPNYNETMLPDDIMEMVAATLTRSGYLQVETSGLTPAPYGTEQGFRFNLNMSTPDGLLMRGMVLSAQRGAARRWISSFSSRPRNITSTAMLRLLSRFLLPSELSDEASRLRNDV
jgi:hypothetical protein